MKRKVQLNRIRTISQIKNGQNLILDDYISHIKNRVPKFFPVLSFANLRSDEHEHIKRRIERFALNSGLEVITRNKSSDISYWMVSNKKSYIREYSFKHYDDGLLLELYPGNNNKQGGHLYNNKLSILQQDSIEILDKTFPLCVKPNLKISDSWGGWKYDITVDTTDRQVLKEIYSTICGKKLSKNNNVLTQQLIEYEEILSVKDFIKHFSNAFKNSDHNYTFLISITIGIMIKELFPYFNKMDVVDSPRPSEDFIVKFANNAFERVCFLIEK